MHPAGTCASPRGSRPCAIRAFERADVSQSMARCHQASEAGTLVPASPIDLGAPLLLGVGGDDCVLDVGERDVEVVANEAKGGEDNDGDQRGDHAVLHRGHAGFVADKAVDEAGHGS